jgi:hypothetical protein
MSGVEPLLDRLRCVYLLGAQLDYCRGAAHRSAEHDRSAETGQLVGSIHAGRRQRGLSDVAVGACHGLAVVAADLPGAESVESTGELARVGGLGAAAR